MTLGFKLVNVRVIIPCRIRRRGGDSAEEGLQGGMREKEQKIEEAIFVFSFYVASLSQKYSVFKVNVIKGF